MECWIEEDQGAPTQKEMEEMRLEALVIECAEAELSNPGFLAKVDDELKRRSH